MKAKKLKKLIKNLNLFLADKDRRISELQEDIRVLVEGGEEAAKVKFKWKHVFALEESMLFGEKNTFFSNSMPYESGVPKAFTAGIEEAINVFNGEGRRTYNFSKWEAEGEGTKITPIGLEAWGFEKKGNVWTYRDGEIETEDLCLFKVKTGSGIFGLILRNMEQLIELLPGKKLKNEAGREYDK